MKKVVLYFSLLSCLLPFYHHSLNAMKRSRHDENTIAPITDTKESKKKHLISEKKPPKICPECNKHLSSTSSLRNHVMLHTGECRHFCPGCDKGYIQRSSFNYHLKRCKSYDKKNKALQQNNHSYLDLIPYYYSLNTTKKSELNEKFSITRDKQKKPSIKHQEKHIIEEELILTPDVNFYANWYNE